MASSDGPPRSLLPPIRCTTLQAKAERFISYRVQCSQTQASTNSETYMFEKRPPSQAMELSVVFVSSLSLSERCMALQEAKKSRACQFGVRQCEGSQGTLMRSTSFIFQASQMLCRAFLDSIYSQNRICILGGKAFLHATSHSLLAGYAAMCLWLRPVLAWASWLAVSASASELSPDRNNVVSQFRWLSLRKYLMWRVLPSCLQDAYLFVDCLFVLAEACLLQS